MDEDITINEIENSVDGVGDLDDDDTADLPTSLIATNVAGRIFQDGPDKVVFENLFREFGDVTFQYFKSFHRVRVNFETAQAAAAARIQLHQMQVCDKIINCYFAQAESPKEDKGGPHLQLPAPVKQFLISPPASPPVGWEPVEEAEPCMNYDLLSAIASLAPGEAHELHPPSESQPAIIVHTCEEDDDANRIGKRTIIQTRCPHRDS